MRRATRDVAVIEELAAKASAAVASSRDLLSRGDADGAVNRAYYAVFNMTRAYLLAIGQPIEGRHGAILQRFGLHLVRPGLIGSQYGRLFHRAGEARSEADYGGGSVPPEEAEEIVTGAEEICRVIALLLGRPDGANLPTSSQP